MKKLNVLALAIVCAFAVVFGVVTFKTNTAQAAVIEGSAPTLGKSFFKISTDGDACMIATAIQDFEFVYAVGYDFEEENVEPIAKATGEYYSAISMGDKRWTPSLIFKGEQDDDYDAATGMIVWELPYGDSTTYHFTAYALWGRKDDETGDIAYDGNKASAETYKLSENYVLSFENGEEDLSGETKNVTIGEAIGELPEITAKAGYTADGWKIADTLIGEGTVWNYRGDKTAQAAYTANEYTLTLGENSKTVTYDAAIGTLPSVPDKTGYTGVGWKIGDTAITAETVWKYTEDQTATAVYTANSYTLSVGGENLTVTYDQAIGTLPAVPDKTGHTGVWKIDDKEINASTVWNYTGDQTATAVYTAITYTFDVDTDGDGTLETEKSLDYGSSVDAMDITSINGNKVLAYFKDSSGNVIKTITDDRALYAVWADKTLDLVSGGTAAMTISHSMAYTGQNYSYRIYAGNNWALDFKPNAIDGTLVDTSYTFYVFSSYEAADANRLRVFVGSTDTGIYLAKNAWTAVTLSSSYLYDLFANDYNIRLRTDNSIGGAYFWVSPFEPGVEVIDELFTPTQGKVLGDKFNGYTASGIAYKLTSNGGWTVRFNATETTSNQYVVLHIKMTGYTGGNSVFFRNETDGAKTTYLSNDTWTHVTFTAAEWNDIVNNSKTLQFSDNNNVSSATFYVSPEFVDNIFTGVEYDGYTAQVGIDANNVYGDQTYSYQVRFHANAWNGTVKFLLNDNAPEAPAGSTHVTFYVYTGWASYNQTLGTGHVSANLAQTSNYSWQAIKFTVEEYEGLKSGEITLQDPNGNSQGRWLTISAPIFSTEEGIEDTFYGSGVVKDNTECYGSDSYSYRFGGATAVICSNKLLELLGDGNSLTFYAKGTASASLAIVTASPWNVNEFTTVGTDWTAVTLTRAQIEQLVAYKYLQIRLWSDTFYISETITVN